MSPPRSPPPLDMYKLRDPLFTYEVCNADDVRRPRWALGRPSYRLALGIARGLGRDDANRRVIGELVRSATGRESTGAILYERFAQLVACGRLVLREVSAPDAYPFPDPYDEPAAPLAELVEDGPAADLPRTTSLEIEVVHQGGGLLPGARFLLTLPDGQRRDVVLDDASCWRADDIPLGPCALEPISPLALDREQYVHPRSPPVDPRDADIPVLRRERGTIRVLPGAKRRLVVLRPEPSPVRAFPAASFAVGSSFPTAAVVPGLNYATEAAAHDPRQRFGVYGHCDVRGSDADNKALSDRRARAVLSLLTADLSMFERVAERERWGLDAYQAMLRALGCNPGAIDGASGVMTKAAIRAFRAEYNDDVFHSSGVRSRQHGDLPEGDELDDATKAAIRDAYHGHHCVGIARERFVGPGASGCGEFNPRGLEHEADRRVTLVRYGDDAPLPSEMPCLEGDHAACTLDDRDSFRCRFYREHVDERPREEIELPFWDFQWLRTPRGAAHLSALTVLPDTDDAEFRVFLWSAGRPTSDSGIGRADLSGHVELAIVPGLIRSGVAYAQWRPPEGYDPFDPRGWFLRPGQRRDDQWLPRFKPPGFAIHREGYWGTSGPPAYLHRRVYQQPVMSGPVVALRDDGALLLNLDSARAHEDAADHRIVNLLGREPHYPKGAASP